MAAPETTRRSGAARAASFGLVALPFAAYALLLAAACAAVPWAPALDDREYLYLANHWIETGRLATDGLFVRVPAWQLLLAGALALLEPPAGIVALQMAIVLAALGTFAFWVRREGLPQGPALLAALLFATSPQVVLYSRHAANELWIGWLAMSVAVLLVRATPRRAAAAGAAVAAAALSKLAALVLAAPALVWIARLAPPRRDAVRAALAFAGGAALVAAPLLALALVQRPGAPLDDTSAFNLGTLDQHTWLALGDARAGAALESFASRWREAPGAALGALVGRAVQWLLRPGSLDLLAWLPYPPLWLELGDFAAFFGLMSLAAAGTRRRLWPVWIFVVGLGLASALPARTPTSPRVAVLFPMLLLAPAGVDVLRRALRRAGARRVDGTRGDAKRGAP